MSAIVFVQPVGVQLRPCWVILVSNIVMNKGLKQYEWSCTCVQPRTNIYLRNDLRVCSLLLISHPNLTNRDSKFSGVGGSLKKPFCARITNLLAINSQGGLYSAVRTVKLRKGLICKTGTVVKLFISHNVKFCMNPWPALTVKLEAVKLIEKK